MWTSMTGYGRAELVLQEIRIGVELKATNHRFQELMVRAPRDLAALEERVRKLLHDLFLRGRMEVNIVYRNQEAGLYRVQVNSDLALAYQKGLEELALSSGLFNDLKLRDLAALPEVVLIERGEADLERIWSILQETLLTAFEAFNGMRQAEGKRLHADIDLRLAQFRRLCEQVEGRVPFIESDFRQRLHSRMLELLGDIEVDQGRLLQEVAVWAEKTSIAEELVRLRSHSAQFIELLSVSEEAVGRRADFLLQEMNREVNTIGSKANDLIISQLVIEMKAELEKVREQMQNVE